MDIRGNKNFIKNTPTISVLMSVYKEPLEWIRKAIDSILNQKFRDFEFIIVNDNPTSIELKNYLLKIEKSDNRIIVITNQENIGLTKSLNIGLKCANGKYIARMDADDISLPQRFEKQVMFMNSHPEVVVCGTRVKRFGKYSPFSYNTIFTKDVDIRGELFNNSGFVHPTVFIRKSILVENNIKYDENFITAQDYKMWFDIRHYGKFANLPHKLLLYRVSKQQITIKSSNTQKKNRLLLSQRIAEDWISAIEKKYQTLRDLRSIKKYLTKSDLILYAYYKRANLYQNPSRINFLKIIFLKGTKITFKERLISFLKVFL